MNAKGNVYVCMKIYVRMVTFVLYLLSGSGNITVPAAAAALGDALKALKTSVSKSVRSVTLCSFMYYCLLS
jgi:hypothetical protein